MFLDPNAPLLPQYMILLGLSGVALFAVSVAALSVPKQFQSEIFFTVWKKLSDDSKANIQNQLDCCGFNEGNLVNCHEGHPLCNSSVLMNSDVSAPMYTHSCTL